ncbi:MAG: iron-sulfur cluster insertion protein ErpA [Bdellovibrionales bacterium]|nr:iron-sulfur cluster insertion protein ErpA [Bdellovibrionales bacterium]
MENLVQPTPNVVQMTEKAAGQVRLIQEREGRTNSLLRVSVVGGGCSGLSYKLSFEEAPKDRDKVIELHGIKVVVDPKSLLFLKGIQVDFTDGLTGQGFVFNNPNAKSSCGCGTSFSA